MASRGLLSNEPTAHVNHPSRWRARATWSAALALALTFLVVDSVQRVKSIATVASFAVTEHRPPGRDPTSPTGYAWNQHHLILPEFGVDGYHWIMQAGQMLGSEGLRVRHTTRDNWPEGREVHWSGSVRWWLAGLGAVAAALSVGRTLPQGIELAAPWANVIILGLFMVLAAPLLARRLAPQAVAVLVLGCIGIYPFYYNFLAGYVDHHGLAVLSCLAVVIALVAGGGGWVTTDDPKQVTRDRTPSDTAVATGPSSARRWFIASGIAGGVGMWVSAATLIPVLAAIGAGALVGTAVLTDRSPSAPQWRVEPSLWRIWGVAGGVTSLAFYAMEYAPSHMGLRLEVNHPLYALAWLAAGDLLARVAGRKSLRPQWHRVALDLLLIALPPILIAVGSHAMFRPADPFLLALHEDYIDEFRSFGRDLRLTDPSFLWENAGLLLLPIAPLVVLLSFRLPRPLAACLSLALGPALLLLGMALWQIRWLGIASAVGLAAFATFVHVVVTAKPRQGWGLMPRAAAVACVILILVPYPAYSMRGPWRHGFPAERDIPQIIARDVSHMLRTRVAGNPVVVLSAPTSTTWLMYFGGFSGIGTLYWENLEGLKAAAAIYGARNAEEAKALIDRHGITHLVFFSWETFAHGYTLLARGQRLDPRGSQATPRDAFIVQLLEEGRVPPWLEVVPYALPDVPLLARMRVWIFEVSSG